MGCGRSGVFGRSVVFGLVRIASVNPLPGDGREVRRGRAPAIARKGDGLGNATRIDEVRYRHGEHDHCPAGTESRRFVLSIGRVAGGAADGNS